MRHDNGHEGTRRPGLNQRHHPVPHKGPQRRPYVGVAVAHPLRHLGEQEVRVLADLLGMAREEVREAGQGLLSGLLAVVGRLIKQLLK